MLWSLYLFAVKLPNDGTALLNGKIVIFGSDVRLVTFLIVGVVPAKLKLVSFEVEEFPIFPMLDDPPIIHTCHIVFFLLPSGRNYHRKWKRFCKIEAHSTYLFQK
jgi:hypothetical protein